MKNLKTIQTGNLLYEIDQLLIELLEGLSLADWEKQTIVKEWRIKDVAVHLLDGNLRALSMLRDNYFGESPDNENSYKGIVEYLNSLNADWVKASRRLSPRVIINLLKISGKEYCDYITNLNPDEDSIFSVAWAGEKTSKNWFHIAREFTEKWHHQQQIRIAVNKENVLFKDKFYKPYLDTSIRALPHHYKNVEGEQGDLIKFTFLGKSNKSWYLEYNSGWELLVDVKETPNCEVRIKDEIAWKIFTKGVSKQEAKSNSKILGKQELGEKIFDMIAIMG